MSDYINFEEKRKNIFLSLFDMQWENKKIWEHIRDEQLTATPAFEGNLYKESKIKIMFVGRDLNGWDESLQNCSTLENTVDSILNQEGAFDTFVDERGFGEGSRKYYHKNSKFFRFIKRVLELTGESDIGTDETWYNDSKKWNQRFVWANLYCISPRNPKNMSEAHPNNAMVKLGIEKYINLMELYIEYYKPDVVIFITDVYGWFIRWSRLKSFKDIVDNYDERLDDETVVASGNVGESKIYICKRPDKWGNSYEDVDEMAKTVAVKILKNSIK